MDDARSSQLWNHTASMMALMANLQRTRKSQKLHEPSEFHPHLRVQPKGHDLGSPAGLTKFRELACPPGTRVTVVSAGAMRAAAGKQTGDHE